VDESRTEPAGTSVGYRIARNAASLLLSNAVAEVLASYSLVLAAVSLGPAGFGRLTEAQAFMEPFESLAGLGLGSVALTFAARRSGCDGALRGTVWGIRCISAVVGGAIGIAVGIAAGRERSWPLLLTFAVGMLFTPITAVSNLPYQYNQTIHKRIAVPFLAQLVRWLASYAALWWLNVPLGYQLALLTATVSSALLQRAWARRDYPEALHFDPSLARQLLALGWPAALLEFIVSCYSRASYVLLHRSGPTVQGEFAAADRLTRPVLALAAALFISSLPSIAQLAARGDIAQLRKAYGRMLQRVTLGLTPILAAAWFFAAWLLARFAPAYSAAIWPFRTLIVGTFFMFLNQMSSAFIMALGRFRLIMSVAIVNLLVYLAIAPGFVAQHGARGAALATTVMEGINTLMQLAIVYALLKRGSVLDRA
jgi:O-antigen/teichoic acid export membrane protein